MWTNLYFKWKTKRNAIPFRIIDETDSIEADRFEPLNMTNFSQGGKRFRLRPQPKPKLFLGPLRNLLTYETYDRLTVILPVAGETRVLVNPFHFFPDPCEIRVTPSRYKSVPFSKFQPSLWLPPPPSSSWDFVSLVFFLFHPRDWILSCLQSPPQKKEIPRRKLCPDNESA